MRNRHLSLSLVILLMASGVGKGVAQTSQFLSPLPKHTVTRFTAPDSLRLPLSPTVDSVAAKPAVNSLPLNFYSTHLGAACKMELQLEKQTKLPIRIRLGSKDQVDYLEGKHNHY